MGVEWGTTSSILQMPTYPWCLLVKPSKKVSAGDLFIVCQTFHSCFYLCFLTAANGVGITVSSLQVRKLNRKGYTAKSSGLISDRTSQSSQFDLGGRIYLYIPRGCSGGAWGSEDLG